VSDNPDHSSKSADDGRGVLGSLPSTRPERIGRRGSGGPAPPRRTAAGQPPPEPPSPDGGPSISAVATTAVQAAGELARIGVTLGGQVLRGAIRRLPRP
jgi:hypothetical protein